MLYTPRVRLLRCCDTAVECSEFLLIAFLGLAAEKRVLCGGGTRPSLVSEQLSTNSELSELANLRGRKLGVGTTRYRDLRVVVTNVTAVPNQLGRYFPTTLEVLLLDTRHRRSSGARGLSN